MDNETVFIHLSDLHVMERPGERFLGVDPDENFRMVIEDIRALPVRPAFIVVSGDLVMARSAAAYERAREAVAVLDEFGVPVLLALGNADDRRLFRAIVLNESDATSTPYYYSRQIGDVRVLVLDSRPPRADGRPAPPEEQDALGPAQLAWLEAQLGEPAPGGFLIVVHHPPVMRDAVPFHNHVLQDGAALARLIAGRPVLGILSGHVHTPIAAVFAGTLAVTAPPVTHPIDHDARPVQFLSGHGYNRCTIRGRTLVANPILLPRPPAAGPV